MEIPGEVLQNEARPVRLERFLYGKGVAPGITIGPVHVFARDVFNVEERRIAPEEVPAELERFEEAIQKAERELRKIIELAREKLGDDSAEIFEAQRLMLRDAAMYGEVTQHIQEERFGADYAVHEVMYRHRQFLLASDNEYLRERANDFIDVQNRIIRLLRHGRILSTISSDSIVVANSLTAADLILFSRRNILGCATDEGGSTSHASIMARALNVPAVVGMHGITEAVQDGDLAILDGLGGLVIVNPSAETLQEWRLRKAALERSVEADKRLAHIRSQTAEGVRIALRANVEIREELPLLQEYGAEGIGLFRTEMLFIMRGRLVVGEEEQLKVYRQVIEHVAPETVTFRVLDLGGDKVLPLAHREQNPFLGWRGIRILLDKPDILIPQVRAMLRASAYGKARILLPMVTGIDEVRRFKRLLHEIKSILREEGYPFDESIEVGIMIEVPAAVFTAGHLAKEVSFFSIGSNDLTQYALAVDRGNDLVAPLYEELHPSVLTLIKLTIDAAQRQNIAVCLCGELASNPIAAPVLVGLGLKELSLSPRLIPDVKRIIREIRIEEAKALAESALAAADTDEVIRLIQRWLSAHGFENLLP